jgi:hypothetical protein
VGFYRGGEQQQPSPRQDACHIIGRVGHDVGLDKDVITLSAGVEKKKPIR